jgi:hypothetical protein
VKHHERPFEATHEAETLGRRNNRRINARFALSLAERRLLVATSLRKRYGKLLRRKPWTETELKRLGPALRQRVEATEATRRWVDYRLRNLEREDDWTILPLNEYLSRLA